MSDNQGPTRDELLAKINELVKPYMSKLEENRDQIQFYIDTGYDHAQRVKPMLIRHYNNAEQQTHEKMKVYHHYRRQFPWEIITSSTLAVSICSLPFGAQTTARNALLTSFLVCAATNPEYLYDKWNQYKQPGNSLKDTTNTWRW